MSLNLSDLGWSFTCITDAAGTRPPPGGLVLQNVRHNHYNFARDLRLIGIRLQVEQVNPPNTVARTTSHFLPLSDPPFTVSPISVLTPASIAHARAPGGTFRYLREADEVLYFSTYFRDGWNRIAYGVRADYTLAANYFSTNFPNCEVGSLTVSQRFLFSRYGNSPPHEPSGALHAARFHPLIKYEFTANPGINRTSAFHRIKSIRFDYRLHLNIDRPQFPANYLGRPIIGNNAGLFRDEETVSVVLGFFAGLGTLPLVGRGAAGTGVPGTAFSLAAFAAVEKPLVLEVVAPGLWEGLSVLGPRTTTAPPSNARRCWDNVHWWGTRAAGYPIISAPGAFHAAHIHWRWGGAGSSIRRTIPEIDTSGVPSPAQGHAWAGETRGALVDPAIWIQTIRVAVVRNEMSLDPSRPNVQLQNLSREDWQTLFTTLRAAPSDIYNGAEIVLWYSAEVHHSTTLPGIPNLTYFSQPSGTVFLHGIFFAHNVEPGSGLVGTTGPEHRPNDLNSIRRSAQWFRPA